MGFLPGRAFHANPKLTPTYALQLSQLLGPPLQLCLGVQLFHAREPHDANDFVQLETQNRLAAH